MWLPIMLEWILNMECVASLDFAQTSCSQVGCTMLLKKQQPVIGPSIYASLLNLLVVRTMCWSCGLCLTFSCQGFSALKGRYVWKGE